MSFFRKDWVSILSLLIGIIGILLSWYFYALSKKEREPAFLELSNFSVFESPEKLTSNKIALVRLDTGKEISKKLFIQEFAFWNEGNESIREDNILTDIKLTYESGTELIDAFIVEVSRPNVTHPKVSPISDSQIVVDFDFLDRGDGFRFQVVYVSDAEDSPEISGDIEGVNSFKLKKDLIRQNFGFGLAVTFFVVAAFILCGIVFGFFAAGFPAFLVKFFPNKFSSYDKASDAVSGIAAYFVVIVFGGLLCMLIGGLIGKFAEEGSKSDIPKMIKYEIVEPRK